MATLNDFPRLNDSERIDARDQAIQNITRRAGPKPEINDYSGNHIQRFSDEMRLITLSLAMLIFLAAFIISAAHIYQTGHELSIKYGVVSYVMGIAFVLLAESAIIGLSVFPVVFETTKDVARLMKYGVYGSAFIAAIGNVDATITFTQSPLNWLTAWGNAFLDDPAKWAFATLPPALTILVGMAFKSYAVTQSIERAEAKNDYLIALKEWESLTADPENSREWDQAYANALWDKWTTVHKRKSIVKDTVFTKAMRRAIVYREMQADQWFSVPDTIEPFTRSSDTDHSFERTIDDQHVQDVPETREPTETDRVVEHLVQFEHDLDMPRRALAEKLGVSLGTAQRGVTMFKNQNGNGTRPDSQNGTYNTQ